MRLSISELTTYRWDFERDIKEYSKRGFDFDGVGIWRRKLDDFGAEAAIDLVAESGIGVSSLTWAGGFTGADVRSYPESIDDGIDAIRLAAALGADCLVVYTGPRAGHTHNHARRLALQALNELVGVASDHDVTLAVEPARACVSDIWSFLNDVDSTLQFMDQIRGGEVKMVYDMYHLAYDQFDPKQIDRIASRTALVQLSDSRGCCRDDLRQNEPSRCRLGEGSVPIADVVAAFESNNYRGFYEVEILGPAIQGIDYHSLLRGTRSFYEGLDVVNSRQTKRSLPRI